MIEVWAWVCRYRVIRRRRETDRARGRATTLFVTWLFLCATVCVSPDPATAADAPRPAILFHTDVALGEQGAGYFEMAAIGARAFAASSDTQVPLIFPRDVTGDARDPDGALATTRFALEQGYTAVIGAGFNYAGPFAALAPEYPDVRFVLIDAVVEAANVESILFREEQGSYLVGVLAALFSDAHHIGFVGGWDAPIIRKFGCGFIQGARSVRPDIAIDVAMIGHTPQAFYQADEGERLARAMFSAGADVVYHAAGQSGDGVIRAAVAHDTHAIGVDINQNGDAPGHVLTSMLKRVDIAVFSSLQRMARGQWSAGLTVLGLREGGVDWALDRYNVQLVSDAMHTAVEDAEFDLRTGHIKAAVYSDRDGCPVHDFGAEARP